MSGRCHTTGIATRKKGLSALSPRRVPRNVVKETLFAAIKVLDGTGMGLLYSAG